MITATEPTRAEKQNKAIADYLSRTLGVSRVNILDDPAGNEKLAVISIPLGLSVFTPIETLTAFTQTCERLGRVFTYPARPDTQTLQDRQRGFE